MKSLRFLAAFTALAASPALIETSRAQNANPPASAEQAPAAAADLEAKFIAMLTNATLKGRTAGIKDGQLGPEKEDSYQIVSVTKIGGDRWTVNARFGYAGKSLVLPIPVEVKWAGDTPVLIVNQLSLGIGPSYSARVLFYDKTYAGTWSGGSESGLISGVIISNG